MKTTVAVLGADGRSGQECVKALLAAGYAVQAGVHSGQLPDHDHLTQQRCDVMNEAEVRSLVQGADVVVSLIGHGKNSPEDLQTTAMRNCIKALEDTPSVRLISLTGTGVRMPADKPTLIDRILNISIKLIDPNRIIDGIEHAKVLQSSSLDWTILRVLKLTDGKHVGQPILTSGGPAELFTPRSRVAASIVQILKDDSYHRAAPIISGTE